VVCLGSERNQLAEGLQVVCLPRLQRSGLETLLFAPCRPVESLHVFDHCPMCFHHMADVLDRGSHRDMHAIEMGEVDGFEDLNCLR